MRVTPQAIRKIILEQSFRAQVGHIGSSLSIADIIAVLYNDILKISRPDDKNRDRFILSKGHAALALYAALHLKGWISKKQLNSFCGDASKLGVHPEVGIPGVDFSTGSLGHGLAMGAGAALAARSQKSKRRIFVLISDAECNEGSTWETVMFAAHHRLSNLVAIVDLNGQQAFGYTKDVLHLPKFAQRWRVFGWDTHVVDGHDLVQLKQTFKELDTGAGIPHVVVAKTIFGKGVSFMHNQIKWHYWPLSPEEYKQALQEIKL
jgi:transketolase